MRRALAMAAGLAIAIAVVTHSMGLESIADACGTAAFFTVLGATFVRQGAEAEETT